MIEVSYIYTHQDMPEADFWSTEKKKILYSDVKM